MAQYGIHCECEVCNPITFLNGPAPWTASFDGKFDRLFPTPRNTTFKKGNKMSFRLIIKDGDTKYKYDPKTGYNKTKTVDRVDEFETFAQALEEFMYAMNDEYGDSKVTLEFKRPKKK